MIQPLTVATLAICIVFFPVVLLFGVARFLFIPLAVTVVLCMLASYVLSFTVVPSFARLLAGIRRAAPRAAARLLRRVRPRLRRGSANGYGSAAGRRAAPSGFVLVCAGLLLVVSGGLATVIGTGLLPDRRCRADQAAFPRAARHAARARPNSSCCRSRSSIRKIIPANELDTINDTIGVPSSFNLAFVPSDNVGGMDAEILISLKPGHHPTDRLYQRPSAPGCPTSSPAACSISRPPTSSARC